MPTLNYENVGALVEYDYLQGTITALYPEDDTADVTLKYKEDGEDKEEALNAVPIFYHCDDESEARSNGAISGAAAGFIVDDNVVVLVGRNGADNLGKEYYVIGHYDGVRTCGDTYILLVEGGRIGHTLYWHDFNGSLIKSKLIEYDYSSGWLDIFFDENFTGPDGIVKIDFAFWGSQFNAVVLRVYGDYPSTDPQYEEWFDGLYTYKLLPLKLSSTETERWSYALGTWQPNDISVYEFGNIAPNIEHNFIPKAVCVTDFGLELHCEFSPANFGSPILGYDWVSYIGSFMGIDSFGTVLFQVVECKIDAGEEWIKLPTTWSLKGIHCACPAAYKDKYLMAIAVFDTSGFYAVGDRRWYEGEFIEAYIGIWNQEDISWQSVVEKTQTWYDDYSASTGGFLGLGTKLINLTKDEFHQLKQIECLDDKIYVFSDSGEGTRLIVGSVRISTNVPIPYTGWSDIRQNAVVNVYSLLGEYLLGRTFSEPYIDRVSVIQRPTVRFGIRLKSAPDAWTTEMLVINTTTLETEKTVDIPTIQAVVVNTPTYDYMTKLINEVRIAQPVVPRYENDTLTSRYYLGYNQKISAIALEFLTMCYARHAYLHEDENGDGISVWGARSGMVYGNDNLYYGLKTNTKEEIDSAMAGWIASPDHFANMIEPRFINHGWASITMLPGYGDFEFKGEIITVDKPYVVYQSILAFG